MRKRSVLSSFSAGTTLALALLGARGAEAAQTLRVQVTQKGDFALIGNTLGWDCGAGAPAPTVGTVPGNGPLACGLNTGDTAPDQFWRSDEPAAGQATASAAITAAQARSTAVLALPANATVTYAYLYWAARHAANAADTSVVIERPGLFSQTVNAVSSYTVPVNTLPLQIPGTGTIYESVADVSDIVRARGNGAYRVSGVDSLAFANSPEDVLFAGWSLVVIYGLATDTTRNLAVFDGLDAITTNGSSSVSLSGFLVPNAGFDAKLGVIAYEGDNSLNGDSLLFGKAPLTNANRLTDALNPVNNFFNGTRSNLGVAVSRAGDLPQLTGAANTMAGLDLDVVDVTSKVTAGQTSVDVQASTAQDTFFLGAFITSISTFKPDFTTSTKSVVDINGGSLLAGDELEYTIVAKNTGNDDSINTVVKDALPTGVTYVPGSIKVTAGANIGAKTDAANDDQAEYTAATRTVTVRIGTGATATAGGTVAAAGTSTVVFRVKVDAGTHGTISNQASVGGAGKRGSPPATTPTDGNAGAPGVPPTVVTVNDCDTDAQCSGTTPHCDTAVSPRICVQCTTNAHCTDPGTTCNTSSHACVCLGSPVNCLDTDGDGLTDGDEIKLGTNPNDADSDDDGVSDGAEKSPGVDSDGDGLINALDPDSDDDGLFDGTELGFDCKGAGTDAALGHCRADADKGATKTDPLVADTDGGGRKDGSEDTNLNGALDSGETDPTTGHGADDTTLTDTDGDGLSDALETTLGSDPKDADTDNDGVPDGEERNPSDDGDGDGLIDVLDVDSDNDGLFDGTEEGKPCTNPPTAPGHCIADGDLGATKTSSVMADTDRGGATDGSEDSNRNGVLDTGEQDPTKGHGADDASVVDTDKDGLSDALEKTLGSDPKDADTDDDGVPDGAEANPGDDTDGDGKVNVLDPDSDGDGLFDGTEVGLDCKNPATSGSAGHCIADADGGKTTTSMVDPDTDHGGVKDGTEDSNHDGAIETGETDPNDPTDDKNTQVPDGGAPDSGIAEAGGATGTAGNAGNAGNAALGGAGGTSTGGLGGITGPDGGLGGNAAVAGATSGTGASPNDIESLAGGGCHCEIGIRDHDGRSTAAWALALGAALTLRLRRRRSR